jgi:hypothetical protein
MVSLSDLTQPEIDVMEQLVQQRTTSVVSLAAALWRTTPDWEAFDPYPALLFILDELSERGLLTYRIEESRLRVRMAWDIRLTHEGWSLMGYPIRHVEVQTHGGYGQHLESTPAMRVDLTNYRHHDTEAKGGPIEVDDFATHRANYPHHIHMYGAEPMTMTRQYQRITPEIEGRVLAIRESQPLMAYADIAEVAGLPERTVRYILTDLPRLRRSAVGTETEVATSLKERVFNLIHDAHPMPIANVRELRDVLGLGDTEHDIMHVLHSLHTQGRVDFDERGNGMGTATVINIRLHKRGANRKPKAVLDSAPVEERRTEHTVGDLVNGFESPEDEHESIHGPEKGWPLLDELLERERNRLDADNKAMRYMEAAEVLRDIDPESYASLMERAAKNDVPFPSPIEQEYLRYVAAHPSTQENSHE